MKSEAAAERVIKNAQERDTVSANVAAIGSGYRDEGAPMPPRDADGQEDAQ